MSRCFTACVSCGGAFSGRETLCPGCGEDLVTVPSLAALDELWLDGGLDDVTYERIFEASRELLDELDDEVVGYTPLALRPVSQKEAFAFIKKAHRHHEPPAGWKFGMGLEDDWLRLCGVITVGRPVSAVIQAREPQTLEVNRVAVDGYRNAASMLLGWARREARKRGFTKLITYILDVEPGTSLRAAGWTPVARVRGRSWNSKTRPRTDRHPTCDKTRWERPA